MKDRVAAVVLSPSAYNALLTTIDRAETIASIRQSMLDMAAGRVSPAREALERVRASANRRTPKKATR